MTFDWHGRELETLGDLMDAVSEIYNLPQGDEHEIAHRQEEARAFMQAYREVSEHADANVGYLSGYFSFEEMPEVMRLFDVEHPILGGPDTASQLTAADAFVRGGAAVKGEAS